MYWSQAWTGDSFRILDLIDRKELKCILSMEIIKEYNRVMSSGEIIEKSRKNNLKISNIIRKVIMNSIIVEPKTRINIVEDKDDNKFIEAAVEGKADYIISQDNHLLKIKEYRGIRIMTPREFLDELFFE
ncbi:putative toxin-antitoxin system toxin component, PIN family [Candidatus Woesearchaeota archaeon]|nr:putative toxin-antitoxin system toxin component, PIN family [Candidatus Woesearchaeota archaeon]